jgi:hypothetical protein
MWRSHLSWQFKDIKQRHINVKFKFMHTFEKYKEYIRKCKICKPAYKTYVSAHPGSHFRMFHSTASIVKRTFLLSNILTDSHKCLVRARQYVRVSVFVWVCVWCACFCVCLSPCVIVSVCKRATESGKIFRFHLVDQTWLVLLDQCDCFT